MDTSKMDAEHLREHKGNVEFAIVTLKQGMYAQRHGHVMSESDKEVYEASRTIAKGVLAKEFERDVLDEELIIGLEQYVENLGEELRTAGGLL